FARARASLKKPRSRCVGRAGWFLPPEFVDGDGDAGGELWLGVWLGCFVAGRPGLLAVPLEVRREEARDRAEPVGVATASGLVVVAERHVHMQVLAGAGDARTVADGVV